METISLNSYEAAIDQMLEDKKFDEAIFNCLHILESYPKNVNVIRLLAKSCLEKQQYAQAARNFLRVLAAIPGDFIAHIGLSVIREEEHHLDAAIWHMERAFEQQPVNPAIQDELRRLYVLQNPEKPAAIQLSRAALVRMYMRGKLFPQAIGESEAALIETPNRLDLMTILVHLYHAAGTSEKAGALCEEILEILPYNLTANQVMGAILQSTGQSDQAKIYTKRCKELDPGSIKPKPADGLGSAGPEIPAAVEKLEDLSGFANSERLSQIYSVLDELSIPTSGVEDWLGSQEGYTRLYSPQPEEATDLARSGDLEPPSIPVESITDIDTFAVGQPENIAAETQPLSGEEVAAQAETGLLEEGPIEESQPESMTENAPETQMVEAAAPIIEDLSPPELEPTYIPESAVVLPDAGGFPQRVPPPDEALNLEEMIEKQEENAEIQQAEHIEIDSGTIATVEEIETRPEMVTGDGEIQEGITRTEDQPAIEEGEVPSPEQAEIAEVASEGDQIIEKLPDEKTVGQEIHDQGPTTIDASDFSGGWIPIETIRTVEPAVEELAESQISPESIPNYQEKVAPETVSTERDTPAEKSPANGQSTEETIFPVVPHEEITKPVIITPQESVSAEVDEGVQEETGALSESSQSESQVEQKPQTVEDAEKKQGFLGWLKSIKSSVQEEIKEPKLPSWMKTGKPTEGIKVPEVSELLEQPTTAENDILQVTTPDTVGEEETSDETQVFVPGEIIPEVVEEGTEEEIIPQDQEEIMVGFEANEIELAGTEEAESLAGENIMLIDDIERARFDIKQGNYARAADRYKKLIKAGRNTNNIIFSLEEAVASNPGEIKLIQTLGDAYVRVGRLQDALDAYTKAEELLK